MYRVQCPKCRRQWFGGTRENQRIEPKQVDILEDDPETFVSGGEVFVRENPLNAKSVERS